MGEVFIREKKMPLSVRAFTLPDSNGDYNIYVNCDLADEVKIKTLEHETRHILKDDFEELIPAHILERRKWGIIVKETLYFLEHNLIRELINTETVNLSNYLFESPSYIKPYNKEYEVSYALMNRLEKEYREAEEQYDNRHSFIYILIFISLPVAITGGIDYGIRSPNFIFPIVCFILFIIIKVLSKRTSFEENITYLIENNYIVEETNRPIFVILATRRVNILTERIEQIRRCNDRLLILNSISSTFMALVFSLFSGN